MKVLGILGGGQLGRMTALAAANFGVSCHIFTPEDNSPAAQVSAKTFVADYNDETALRAFADSVDVITLEFENIPVETIQFLKQFKPVFPDDAVLLITQDRVKEKSFCNDMGIATVPWRAVRSANELQQALTEIGMPSVLKTARFGYDGKGQVKISNAAHAATAWHDIFAGIEQKTIAILEGFVEFAKEVSVLVARNAKGEIKIYPIAHNIHHNHILAETHVPAEICDTAKNRAHDIATRLADALQFVGILCIEMFVMKDSTVLVNEMAPRPHNSGHWTIDAAPSSQFEQMVRIACDLPLGETDALYPSVMTNLIGDDWLQWRKLAQDPSNRVHLYGKSESHPGRKMGHVTKIMYKSA